MARFDTSNRAPRKALRRSRRTGAIASQSTGRTPAPRVVAPPSSWSASAQIHADAIVAWAPPARPLGRRRRALAPRHLRAPALGRPSRRPHARAINRREAKRRAQGSMPRFRHRRSNFMRTTRRAWLSAVAALIVVTGIGAPQARAEDTIKIGILHSLSGTMAISETILKDLMLMQVADLNAHGGLLGKKVEPVVVDPASNWPLFAEKARELISKDKVAAVFGCWTSVSRKSVLPVFEELNGLLFYPLEYEGEESSYNVFYGSSVPDNKAIPAVKYLMSDEGGGVKRFVLEGTDYVYPRTSNKIIRAYLKSVGVADEDIRENYTPFGFSDWQTEVAAIKAFGSAGKKTAVVSTINGDANVPFYKELGAQGVKATDIPVIAFSVGEEELAGIDTKPLVGHLAAWSYFESVDTPENKAFIAKWRAYSKKPDNVTNDPMESAYILFHMWVQAVEQAGTTDVDAVRQAMIGQTFKAPSGDEVVMGANHHMAKPVMIGEIQADGQFDVVYKSDPLPPRAWSPYVEANKGKVADWSYPWVCGGCTAPKYTTF
jgi:branched-chain amino acid transport system substrate-binding protein/urea transport system substrate-binding protein